MKTYYFLLSFFLISACSQPVRQEEAHDGHIPPGSATIHSMDTYNYADSVNEGLITNDTMKGSVHRTSMATIGKTHVHIEYSSPGVKNRIIWGGLVPDKQVWVAGAHHATSIAFNNDILLNNQRIEEGTYALFVIPDQKNWTVVLNRNYEQHLTDDYTEAEDVCRIVLPVDSVAFTPRLTYKVQKIDSLNGSIIFSWEKRGITIPFRVANGDY